MTDHAYEIQNLDALVRDLRSDLENERRDRETEHDDHRRRIDDVEHDASRAASLASRLEANRLETDEHILNLESAVNEQRNETEKLEALERAAAEAFVSVNRRLDLIEADVIDRAEETHRRITRLLEGSTAVLDRVEALEGISVERSSFDQLRNDLATLALRCGMTDGRSRVKLSVDRGEEAGS